MAIIWSIRSYLSSNTLSWHIFHSTPWGDKVSWRSSTYDGALIEASASFPDEMQIRYASGTGSLPRIVVARKGRCVCFNQEGNAELGVELYCQPISTRIVRPVEWRDAAEKIECPSTLIQNLMKKVGHEMKGANNVHATDWKQTLCGGAHKVMDSIGCLFNVGNSCQAATEWRPDDC